MAGPATHITAAKTDRSLVSSAPTKQSAFKANPHLLFWRRMLESAVADSVRTYCGLPTDSAILARWWIEEHKPSEADGEQWEVSFDCVCQWLNLDAKAERERLVKVIDETLRESYIEFVRASTILRRAAVLACAGMPTAIDNQYQMPLVREADYEHVAGVDHPDPPPRHSRKYDPQRQRIAA